MCQSENIYSDKHKKHCGNIVICNFATHQIVVMFFLFIAQLYFQEAEHALRHCCSKSMKESLLSDRELQQTM